MRRLSDKLTIAFYAACEIGNLHAAGHLLTALECEVARSVRLGRDKREDGNDLAAVRARLQLELNRQRNESRMARDLQNQVTKETSPSDAT